MTATGEEESLWGRGLREKKVCGFQFSVFGKKINISNN
jgi:hypothetical protein